MKLSVSYNFFNGEEHLESSIQSIRNSVDYITIVFQSTSNSGNKISTEALDALNDIRSKKLVDKIIDFSPDFSKTRQTNELAKRKIGLDEALHRRCTHFFTMDADEFYRKHEIEYAKDYIIRNRIWATSVSSFFHIKTPNWRAKDTTCCAFITKINERTEIGSGGYYIDMVDPTRSLKTPMNNSFIAAKLRHFFPSREHHHFSDSQIAMYHMNFVRKDSMESKLANTSTTDTNFLADIKKRYLAWEPGKVFSFPNKGDFTFQKVENEFKTWTPLDTLVCKKTVSNLRTTSIKFSIAEIIKPSEKSAPLKRINNLIFGLSLLPVPNQSFNFSLCFCNHRRVTLIIKAPQS